MTRRLPALDGLRGCLALLVVVYHATDPCPITHQLMLASRAAVAAFFVLSGWVLVRGWDERYGEKRVFSRTAQSTAFSQTELSWLMPLPPFAPKAVPKQRVAPTVGV